MTDNEKINRGRRRIIKYGAAAGAVVALGGYFRFGGEVRKAPDEVWDDRPDAFEPGAWLRIEKDGKITVRVNHSEMGQGITTAFAMIVAEELEADWSKIEVEIAPAEEIYKNPEFKMQLTGGSTSVKTSWNILRNAGACAREMLIQAGADEWNVNAAECLAENGFVIYRAGAKRLSFGELTSKASKNPIPENVKLKEPDQFKLIGQRTHRLDSRIKAEGKAVYGIDVEMDGLLTATVIHPPVFGARLKSIDKEEALHSHGVRYVIELDTGVAVVADKFYQAAQGAGLLKVEWDEGERKDISSESIRALFKDAAVKEGKEIHGRGDVVSRMKQAVRIVEAVYELPFQAHATPEPMNCTAHVTKERCDIWVPTQNQDGTQETAARITGLGYDQIKVHTTYLGGGFGRRNSVDYAAEAVQVSKAVNAPVKVVWSREEDIRHDHYRPASYNLLRAGLDEKGFPAAWSHKIVGPDHMAHMISVFAPTIMPYFLPRIPRNIMSYAVESLAKKFMPGRGVSEGAFPEFYDIKNFQVSYVDEDPGIPLGFWRSVGYSSNVFVVESFMDEVASASGKDPFDLRYELLSEDPKLRKVLKSAAEKAGYIRNTPNGKGMGIAVCDFHGTKVCLVAEVSVGNSGDVKVHKMTCALDCGTAINPAIIEAQIEGGIAFGLTATLKSQATINNGRVEESNFHDFPLLKIDEMPEVEVFIEKSDEPPQGIGEVSVPVTAPAVCNAIFSATGKRVRKIPVSPKDLLGV